MSGRRRTGSFPFFRVPDPSWIDSKPLDIVMNHSRGKMEESGGGGHIPVRFLQGVEEEFSLDAAFLSALSVYFSMSLTNNFPAHSGSV